MPKDLKQKKSYELNWNVSFFSSSANWISNLSSYSLLGQKPKMETFPVRIPFN